MFGIEDERHAETFGEYRALVETVSELERLAQIPWDVEPNQAPCTNWKNCGREYWIFEYDDSIEPRKEIRSFPALRISAHAVRWTPIAREVFSRNFEDEVTVKFAEVRKILMSDWDPIGVEGVIEAEDEYDTYIDQILSLSSQGATEQDVANHLMMVTKDLMGLEPNDERILKAAAKIALALSH